AAAESLSGIGDDSAEVVAALVNYLPHANPARASAGFNSVMSEQFIAIGAPENSGPIRSAIFREARRYFGSEKLVCTARSDHPHLYQFRSRNSLLLEWTAPNQRGYPVAGLVRPGRDPPKSAVMHSGNRSFSPVYK